MIENRKRSSSYEELLTRLLQGGSDMFGYLIRGRRGILSDAMARRYHSPAAIDDMPGWMVAQGHVARESAADWLGLFDAIDRGERKGAAMVSLRLGEEGDFKKYWLRFNGLSDEQGSPSHALISFDDFAVISFDDFTAMSDELPAKEPDLAGLLQATKTLFPEIFTMDLTKGTYRIVSCHRDTFLVTPMEGRIDDLISLRMGGVIEADRERYFRTFSFEALRESFIRENKDSAQLVYRRLGKSGGAWFETTIIRQNGGSDGDVMLVIMSRNIDEAKAEEMRLRDQLWLQAEEIRVTTSNMRRTICYYDVPSRTLTVPPSYAKERGIAETVPNYPDSMFLPGKDYYPETPRILRDFCDAMLRGEPTGSCEVPFKLPGRKGSAWKRMEYAMVFDQGGLPQRAVIFVDDVTDQHRLSRENRMLRENARILRLINQHSDRTICHYDVRKKLAGRWDEDTCAKCRLPRLCEMPPDEVLGSGDILPESVDGLRAMFRDIHKGVPSGALKMHVKQPDGQKCWFDLRYSTITDSNGAPITAMISHKDITEQYEHELAYLRHVQSLNTSANHLGILEVDLSTDLIENQDGKMIPPGAQAVGLTLTDFARKMVRLKLLPEDQAEGLRFYSGEYLTAQYEAGVRHLERVWQMRFRDGALHWVQVTAELVSDPYTGHQKALFRMTDITEEHNTQLEIKYRSERDGMTGLLNRATVEARVRELMADNSRPGIMVLIDLDNLKGINDTFGHKEGDRAILGISETLKTHFRDSDVVGRIGGDEFLIYLPGAAENREAISASCSNLLRKLTVIPIGSGNEQRIHCSIGCAIQEKDDPSFDSLYKRADIALYHVKRSGKNNHAFYSPEMEEADYRFQSQRLLSLQSEKKFEVAELHHLLAAISDFYQLVLSMNLSRNDYFLMEEVKDGVFSALPACGLMDDFVSLTARGIHPGDVPGFLKCLSREALLQAYEKGEKSVHHYFRFRKEDGYMWTEAAAIFYTNEKGDVCDFTLVRWADERFDELDRLWMQKVLELAVVSSFEYICLLDIKTGDTFLYCDEKNSHGVPKNGKFDEITRSIRDQFIPPEEQAAYYEKARLSTVAARMKECNGSYTYRYNMPDGPREASFYWFEPSHHQLLMTVQRCDRAE